MTAAMARHWSKTGRARICSIAGDLGFGFPDDALRRGIELKPDVIAVQGTSADPGAYYLGAGESFYPIDGVRRDLDRLIPAATKAGIPVVMSAGGAGSRATLEPVRKALSEAISEHRLTLRVAVIYSDVEPAYLKMKLSSGVKVPRLGRAESLSEALTVADIEKSDQIVAQIGPEPIMRALEEGADVVLAGRTVDVSLFAAVPLLKNCATGPTYLMAKILECGAMAAEPSTSADGLVADIEGERFTIEPLSPSRHCTRRSIAGHTFYEREDPFVDDLPGGTLDSSAVAYEQLDERRVSVSGVAWKPEPYTVKLEGAGKVGYRTVCIAGIRDPIMIGQIEAITERTRERSRQRFGNRPCEILFRTYGHGAIMGAADPVKQFKADELCLVIDVVAPTQDFADEVCAFLRSAINHDEFPGCRTSAGNVAFPFSPSDLRAGPVFQFTIWHLLGLDDPLEVAKIEWFEVKNGEMLR
jgi:hypothetical protein